MRIGVRSQSIAIYLAASLFAVSGAALAQAPTFLPTLVTVAGNRTSGYSGDGQLATTAEVGNTISAGTMDPAGNIYIADTKNNVIRKVTPAGIISTFAGLAPGFAVCAGATDAVGDGCLATNASMNAPGSVRYHQGGIYITDFNNGRIRRVDLITNMIATIAGGGTLSLNNANPSNPGTSIAVPQPQDTVFDNLGNMYWTQGGGTSRVDVLNLVTGIAYIFAGDGGTTGATGTEISAAGSGRTSPENTAFNGPQGLAVDAQNNVYVVEYSTKVIRKITVGAVPMLSTYAGIGTSGTITICGGATNSLGDGCPGPNASFGTIEHMSIDGNGVIYVADSTNNRIRVIQPNPSNPAVGGTVSTLIGNGTAADSPDGTYAAEATIGTPYDSQILPNGDLLLIDRVSSLVRILHNPGAFLSTSLGSTTTEPFNVLTQAGTGTVTLPGATDFSSTTAPTCAAAVGLTGSVCSFNASFKPTLAGFRTNQMQFTDANGTAVVGVSGVGIAPVASLLPGLTSTVAGTGISGATGDGAAAALATFMTPAAMTTDSQGNVYVADSAANEVRKFSPGGTITRIAGTGAAGSSGDGGAATAATLTSPGGVAVDPAGNVYIADTGNNKIRMVSAANGTINTIAGTGTAGYTGDQSTPITATLTAPTQLAWSPLGILYVADTGNSAVRAIALSESLITTAAGSANPGFDGDGGPGQSAQLLNPSGVAVDANNDVYIADTGNNRVRQLTQGYINTIAGQTGAGYSGDGVASTAELNAPQGLAADTAGNVYVADTGNQRIRLISGGVQPLQIATIMGTGTPGSSGDGASSALATVSSPQGVALDPMGDVYVADTGNHKIRGISAATNTLTFPTTNPNDDSVAQTVTVYNSGNQALAVSSVTVPSGYIEQASASGVDCTSAPLNLAPGASCNLNTVFNPPFIGPYNSTVSIADNSEAVATAGQGINVVGVSAYVFTAKLTLPGTATAGAAINGTLAVTNPVATYTGTVAFTSTDPLAVLPAKYTFTTANAGMLAVSVTYKTAGPQCVTATDVNNSSVTSTACTTVAAAAAAKINVYTGNNQTANVSTLYGQRLVAYVTDAYGNPVANAPVTFTINPNGATTATFTNGTATYSTTSVSGYATAQAITSGAIIGTYTVTAALTGGSSSATFNLTTVVLGGFTIVPTATQVGPVEPGSTSTENITVVTTGGFTAPITFTCSAPSGITCSAGPSPFFVANQSKNPASLNFTSEGTLRNVGGFSSPLMALLTLAASCLLLGRRRKLGAVAIALLAMIALGAVSGCTGEQYSPTTPNGMYTVTVTGTAQTVSASATVTYTVQQ